MNSQLDGLASEERKTFRSVKMGTWQGENKRRAPMGIARTKAIQREMIMFLRSMPAAQGNMNVRIRKREVRKQLGLRATGRTSISFRERHLHRHLPQNPKTDNQL